MTNPANTDVVTPMTPDQRAEFERSGFLVIPGALSEPDVAFYSDAIDRVHAAQQAAGRLSPKGAMHLLSAVTNCLDAAGLIDHPRTFPLVWSMLGWNVHIYHSHLDVHPPIRVPKPFRFEWHQDGGRAGGLAAARAARHPAGQQRRLRPVPLRPAHPPGRVRPRRRPDHLRPLPRRVHCGSINQGGLDRATETGKRSLDYIQQAFALACTPSR